VNVAGNSFIHQETLQIVTSSLQLKLLLRTLWVCMLPVVHDLWLM